jgi:hypothetical protein
VRFFIFPVLLFSAYKRGRLTRWEDGDQQTSAAVGDSRSVQDVARVPHRGHYRILVVHFSVRPFFPPAPSPSLANCLSTPRYAPQVLEQSPQDELMTFMLVFLSTPYMKNPYLKGQFVEIMYNLSRPTYTSPRGCLGDVINFHPLALRNLMPCLVHAYIGSSSPPFSSPSPLSVSDVDLEDGDGGKQRSKALALTISFMRSSTRGITSLSFSRWFGVTRRIASRSRGRASASTVLSSLSRICADLRRFPSSLPRLPNPMAGPTSTATSASSISS